jgi:hypothetical protein
MTYISKFDPAGKLDQNDKVRLFPFAALFAIVTYAAISTRALLNPYETNYLVDAKRIFSVLLGAVILWLALRSANRNWRQKAAIQLFAVLRISAVGVLTLFAAREIYDLAASGELATNLAVNIRFMLTWIGYFGAAVAAFLALGYYRQMQAVITLNPGNAEEMERYMAPTAKTAYEVADLDFDPRAAKKMHH